MNKLETQQSTPATGDEERRLLSQYNCGPIQFAGTDNALYERHLVFDKAIDPQAASARERFEAFARSVRDVLAQRCVLTANSYARENPSTSTTSPWSS